MGTTTDTPPPASARNKVPGSFPLAQDSERKTGLGGTRGLVDMVISAIRAAAVSASLNTKSDPCNNVKKSECDCTNLSYKNSDVMCF